MQKHFNTAGPNVRELHYGIDPLTRFDLASMVELIAQQRYFVLHAPRQTGKTTCLLSLREHLNKQGDFTAVYVNIEPAQAFRGNVAPAMQTIVSLMSEKLADALAEPALKAILQAAALAQGPGDAVRSLLRVACERSACPIVLFLDEVDALVGDTLISLLRQIRAGYTDRPQHFPQTIVLCGVRDVRDYRMTMADGEVITGGSAFNIKAESLRLGDFSRAEMTALYQQHTDATGQVFAAEALELAWLSTQGQPWLVNALAEQAVWKSKANLDRTIPIDLERLRDAREALILRNDTHLDQLADKLREPRVRAVIEPMLIGEEHQATDADIQYVLDLGLVRRTLPGKSFAPSNQIYAEVLPRVLNNTVQYNLHEDRILASWQDAKGQLQPRQFLLNFLDFWRSHGESMMRSVPYHEAAPHLVLMAYLQRVINGGGRIEREYAAGAGRLDLLVIVGAQQMAIEIKVWRSGRKDPLADGLLQMQRYLQRLNLSEGYLVIFDQRETAALWERRMRVDDVQTLDNKAVMVLRA
jgi:hypothetical protein